MPFMQLQALALFWSLAIGFAARPHGTSASELCNKAVSSCDSPSMHQRRIKILSASCHPLCHNKSSCHTFRMSSERCSASNWATISVHNVPALQSPGAICKVDWVLFSVIVNWLPLAIDSFFNLYIPIKI